MEGYVMAGRYIVKKFKNGVKHMWDTETGKCIHWDKVKERIPKEEFDELFEDFNRKQPKKSKKGVQPFPKISEILSDVIGVYADKISIEEIVGALEIAKNHAMSLHEEK